MKTPKSKTSYKQYLRHAYINSLQLNPVTEEEIKKKPVKKKLLDHTAHQPMFLKN